MVTLPREIVDDIFSLGSRNWTVTQGAIHRAPGYGVDRAARAAAIKRDKTDGVTVEIELEVFRQLMNSNGAIAKFRDLGVKIRCLNVTCPRRNLPFLVPPGTVELHFEAHRSAISNVLLAGRSNGWAPQLRRLFFTIKLDENYVKREPRPVVDYGDDDEEEEWFQGFSV